MKFLLDTHAWLWWLFDDPRLPRNVRSIIAEPTNQILVSAASAWEIATKYRIGKLPSASVLVQDIDAWRQRSGFVELPVTIAHAQKAGMWVAAHRDPFDRMLAAQSAIEQLPLVSMDPEFQLFGITVIWHDSQPPR